MAMSDDELEILQALESEVSGHKVSDEELRAKIADLPEGDVEALEGLFADEKKPEKKAEVKVEAEEEKADEVEDEKPGLSEEVRLQLRTSKKAEVKTTLAPDFKVETFVELLNKDAQQAWDYIEPHTNAGKKLSTIEKQFAAAEQDRKVATAELFVEKNPDYPYEDEEVNNFMAAAMDKLKLAWTPGNLTRVWAQAKTDGLARGKKVKVEVEKPAEKGGSDEKKVKTTKTAVPPVAKAKTGAAKTGAAGDTNFWAALDKLIDNTDPDELERKLRKAGLYEEGSLSRLMGQPS